jgi:hypothetical protein
VTRRAKVFLFAMAGFAAAVLYPAVASAATQCKSTPVEASGALTEDQAIAAWTATVKQTYGVEWSNFNLAKNPKFSEQNLALANMFFVTAAPCRTITVVNTAATVAKPNLAIQRH